MKALHVGRITLITLVALLAVSHAYAHHTALGTCDYGKPVTLTGAVVKYEMHSPHVHITMAVKNSAGAVELWTVESGAVGSMLRMGLVSDPVYLTRPYSATVSLYRLPDDTPMSFKCDLGSANRFLK
ncbi:MAG: DUF6152 family protein [Steroidobacteraceae bacterium]